MIKMFLFFALTISTLSAFAELPNLESQDQNQGINEVCPPPYPPAYPPQPMSGWSYVNCNAYTVCPNGMPINCWVNGSTYTQTACTWSVVPGAYVECRGFDSFGRWINAWARCY